MCRFRRQVQVLEATIEGGVSCSYARQQLSALRGAVNGMIAEVLESHLRETLAQPMQHDDVTQSTESSINDTVTLIRTYLK
ncbi:transcriptional regulator [Formosimonas limnophila]|uniref:Transcriptional regulator n=1 Tax=Formosimonas limnophila TaxID=1384487 RepID=A0A8J3FZB3_9BURK|nr:metal-sensing transcriptional repressor [Formosimonas limnophila]GHA72607.1 transcriptional regulator [Formosimonas limnophila]